MRNLIWTSAAVVFMLANVNSVSGQPGSSPSVEAKVNTATSPPAGKKDCYAKGTYSIPGNKTINKVVAKWYEEEAGTGNLIFKGTTSDLAPAANNYTTPDLRLDTGKTYTVIVTVYVDGAGGATDPVQQGPQGVLSGFAP